MDQIPPPANSPAVPDTHPSLYPILAVNFVGALGYSIILPFLVFLVTRLGGNALVYGIIGATYWLIFLSALMLPLGSGWKIESSVLGTFMVTLPIVVLFVARALDGLTGGNVSVANAYLADVTDEEHRNENFGKMAIWANLGFILGPALAGLLGATVLGETLPVLAALLISFIASLMIAFDLPESHPCFLSRDPELINVRKVFGQEQSNCFALKGEETITLWEVFQLKDIPYLTTLYFMIFLGFNLFYTAFPFHAVRSLGWSLTNTGLFFSVLSLLMVVVQGPVLSRATKLWSDVTLIIAGSLILGTNFLLLTSTDNRYIYTAALLFALGNGLMWPSVLSILSKAAGERAQGSVQGFASSFGSVASILGLTLGGILYEMLGSAIFLVSAGIIYVVSVMAMMFFCFKKELPVTEGS